MKLALLALGIALLVGGVATFSLGAALITGGVVCLVAAYVVAYCARPKGKDSL